MNKEELEKEAYQFLIQATKDKRIFYFGGNLEEILAEFAEPREKRIAELEAQIKKMQNCKNCANYMISGKCPSFFRTGWCKNWEMTRSKKWKK